MQYRPSSGQRMARYRCRTSFIAIAPLLCVVATFPLAAAEQEQASVANEQTDRYREYAPGLLVRKTYVSGTDGELRAGVWDLLVGPGKRTSKVSLPGAAILLIRSGKGLVSVADKREDVSIGMALSIAQGDELVIDNRQGTTAIAIRAIVVARQ